MSIDPEVIKRMRATGVPDSVIEGMIKVGDAADELVKLHGAHVDELAPIEIDDAGVMHGQGVTYVPSVRHQALATPSGHVEGLVAHWTDTNRCGAVNLAKRIVGPVDAAHARSCHLWIDQSGAIAQSVPLTRGSWHAGGYHAALFRPDRDRAGAPSTIPAHDRTWLPQKPGAGGVSANSWAGGIEFECVGEVRHVDGKWLGWPFKFGGERPAEVSADEVVALGTMLGHQRFTSEQVKSARRVYLAIIRRYDLNRANCSWGHCDIDPQNRPDPGPLFMGKGRTFAGGILQTLLDEAFGPAT